VLRRFIHTAQPGPWFDQPGSDDRFVIESVQATQLYDIVGAVAELRQVRLFERVVVVSNSLLVKTSWRCHVWAAPSEAGSRKATNEMIC
jgi:hypothetical protein